MDAPFLMKSEDNVVFTLRQIVDMAKTIERLGCLDDMLAKADEQKIGLSASKASVNFVKTYLFQGRFDQKSDDAKKYITSATCGGRAGDGWAK